MAQHTSETQAVFEQYLTQPEWQWNWFVTQTFDVWKCGYIRRSAEFKLALHSEIVKESWEFFLDLVAEVSPGVWGWMFCEKHVSGRPHWHAIVHVDPTACGEVYRKDVWRRMFDKYGIMEIAPFVHGQRTRGNVEFKTMSDALSRYLVKYVAKDMQRGEATFDFGGSLDGFRADTRQIMGRIGLGSTSIDHQRR